jgi:hypothetical protein
MSKIEDKVCEKIQARAEVGLKKYGTTMEREDFSDLEWMTYLQEELMDSVVYLQRMMDNHKKTQDYNTISVLEARVIALDACVADLIELLPKREFNEFSEQLNNNED